jgi:hypothetical protein
VSILLWLGIAGVVASGAWLASRAYRARRPRRLVARASAPLEGEERRIVLGPAQHPYVTLQLATALHRARPHEAVALPSASLAALAPLLEQCAPLLRAGSSVSAEPETRLVVSFAPSTARTVALGIGAASGPRDRAFHAIARARSGRVIDHGELDERADPPSIMAALWNVASVLTVQSSVLDIEAHLTAIADRIATLRASFGSAFAERLAAAVDHLKARDRALRDGRLPTHAYGALEKDLERIDRDARVISTELLSDMLTITQRLDAAKWGGVFGVGREMAQARDAIHTLSTASEKVWITVHLRLLVLTLYVGLGFNASRTDDALKLVTADLSAHRDAWRKFGQALTAKLPELAATLHRRSTDAGLQDELRRELDDVRATRLSDADQSSRLLVTIAAAVTDDRADPTRTIELELLLAPDGSVTCAERLLRARQGPQNEPAASAVASEPRPGGRLR